MRSREPHRGVRRDRKDEQLELLCALRVLCGQTLQKPIAAPVDKPVPQRQLLRLAPPIRLSAATHRREQAGLGQTSSTGSSAMCCPCALPTIYPAPALQAGVLSRTPSTWPHRVTHPSSDPHPGATLSLRREQGLRPRSQASQAHSQHELLTAKQPIRFSGPTHRREQTVLGYVSGSSADAARTGAIRYGRPARLVTVEPHLDAACADLARTPSLHADCSR